MRKGTPGGLKMPDLEPYDGINGEWSSMLRRWILVLGVITVGLMLSGCTKCGPIWDDWIQGPKSCRSDHL